MACEAEAKVRWEFFYLHISRYSILHPTMYIHTIPVDWSPSKLHQLFSTKPSFEERSLLKTSSFTISLYLQHIFPPQRRKDFKTVTHFDCCLWQISLEKSWSSYPTSMLKCCVNFCLLFLRVFLQVLFHFQRVRGISFSHAWQQDTKWKVQSAPCTWRVGAISYSSQLLALSSFMHCVSESHYLKMYKKINCLIFSIRFCPRHNLLVMFTWQAATSIIYGCALGRHLPS